MFKLDTTNKACLNDKDKERNDKISILTCVGSRKTPEKSDDCITF